MEIEFWSELVISPVGYFVAGTVMYNMKVVIGVCLLNDYCLNLKDSVVDVKSSVLNCKTCHFTKR